jgi:prepilin-type N-terminal cleavage/methylation domain-containing protein
MSERSHHRGGALAAGRRGFSLTELLVAMCICVVLLRAMLEITARAGRGFGRAQQSIQRQAEARGALHFIAVDLASRVAGTPLDWADDAAAVWPCGRLGFFRIAGRGELPGPGDVVFVSYEVRTLTEQGQLTRQLVRSVWPPLESLAALSAGGLPGGPPVSEEALACQVVGFAVRPRMAADAPAELAGWELRLSVTDEATARRLLSVADWRGTSPLGVTLVGAGAVAPTSANVESYQVDIAP